MLDETLAAAGLDRAKVYVTNAVQHFKFEPRGKRRRHKKPRAHEIAACQPWLQQELALVRPRELVCLGATAAQALLGGGFRVTRQRGETFASAFAPATLATVHPSSILRLPRPEARAAGRAQLAADFQRAARALATTPVRR